jgi:hypothetical protein
MIIMVILSALAAIAAGVAVWLWVSRTNLSRRVQRLNDEMLEASKDASVGHRLTIPNDPATSQIAQNVNRLFDAVSERDDKIQGRDILFRDFARTLPEIVFIHNEKILLPNDSAASLVGLEPALLVGRDVADLVKPA